MNAHVHFHCCVIDGVFAAGEDGQVHFAEAGALTPEDLAAVQQQVRARVLRWFARAGHLDPADARDMAGWHHGGGFSLDASVRIEGADRAGLERLLRYCARPPFALERLEQLGHDQLVYRFPKPQPDGRTELRLTPLELIERLAALIPPPRLHRHRYHGVLAPNSPLRAQVIALARQPPPPMPNAAMPRTPPRARRRATCGRVLLARIYEILPLRCALCGAQMRIIAFVTDAAGGQHDPHPPGRAHHPSRSGPAHVAPRCGSRRPSRWPTGMTPRHPCPSSSSTSAWAGSPAHSPAAACRAPPTGSTATLCPGSPKPRR